MAKAISADPFANQNEKVIKSCPIDMTFDTQLKYSGLLNTSVMGGVGALLVQSNSSSKAFTHIQTALQLYSVVPIIFGFSDITIVDPTNPICDNILKREYPPINACVVKTKNKDIMMIITLYREDPSIDLEILVNKWSNNKKMISLISTIYLHEMLHLIQRHLDRTEIYMQYVERKAAEFNVNINRKDFDIHDFLNIALDAHINSTLVNMNEITKQVLGSIGGIVDQRVKSQKQSEFDVIDMFLEKNGSDMQFGDGIGSISTVKIGGKSYITGGSDPMEEDSSGESDGDGSPGDGNKPVKLKPIGAHGIDDMVETIIEKMRGTDAVKILADMGVAIKTKTDWFELIKNTSNNIIRRITDDLMVSWAKPNYLTHRVMRRPGYHYLDNKPLIVMSFDQSGSMSDLILRKFNYYIMELLKDEYPIKVIVHDVDIADIFDSNEVDLVEEMKQRRAGGGTSHVDVFKVIQDFYEEFDNMFVLICSDMYSDIENIHKNYEWISSGDVPILGVSDGIECPIKGVKTIIVKE